MKGKKKITIRTINEEINKLDNKLSKFEKHRTNIQSFILAVLFLILLLNFFTPIINNFLDNPFNEYIPSEEYDDFRIEGDNIKEIYDFLWLHDFSKDSGLFNFTMENSTGEIFLIFPSNIEINSTNDNTIRVKINTNEQKYSIPYFAKINPNSIFVISHSNIKLQGEPELVNFILGDKYSCFGSCIKGFNNVLEKRLSDNKNIQLLINEGERHEFRLNVIYDKKFKQGLYIGLIVSVITLIISISIELFLKKIIKPSTQKN